MRKRVYIINDNTQAVDALALVLRKAGYDIEAQFDDVNVVENVAKVSPQLIILDVIFSEDDSLGIDLARSLHNDSRTKKIPIVMLSAADGRESFARRFANRGCDEEWLSLTECLEKPVEPAQLLEVANRLCGEATVQPQQYVRRFGGRAQVILS